MPSARTGRSSRAMPIPFVFDRPLLITDQTTECQSHTDHSSLEHTALVPNYTGDDGGLPSSSTSQGSDSPANRSGLYNEARGSGTSCMAYFRKSFTSQGISGEATDLLLSSWRSKTKSNYNSLFAK